MKLYIPTPIDPNNLPEGEVIAINDFISKEFLVGHLTKNEADVVCEDENQILEGCTHYLREVTLPDEKMIEEMAEERVKEMAEKGWNKYIALQLKTDFISGATAIINQLK